MNGFSHSLLSTAMALVLCSCGSGPVRQEVSGTVETDQVRVASRYGGRVKTVLASEGETLEPGRVIVELEAAELAARMEQARAFLAELSSGPRPEEIAVARSEWEALGAEVDQARADARRAEELFAQKTISTAEKEVAATKLRRLEKSVEAAKNRLNLLLAGTRPEKLAQARAQVAETEAQVAEMKVAAPAPCVLETLHVKPGDVLTPGRQVATLLLTNRLWVRVFVPEPWLGRIKPGQKAVVRTDSDPHRDFSGEVEQIARAAEFTPRNVQTVGELVRQVFGVKLRLDNSAGNFRAGMAVDVLFPGAPPPP